MVYNNNQERILRKEERGEERKMTTHLIKIQIFTHASRVTKFSLYELCTYSYIAVRDSRPSGACTIPRLPVETKRKAFG